MADPTALRLGWMLAALTLALAPAVPRLPAWITLVFVAAAAWRLAIQREGWRLPPGWLRLALAAACLFGVLFHFRTLNGLEAGGALLVVMGAMKLLETRSRRDIQVLAFIGYFIVMMQLLYDQPIWSLPWLALSVAAVTLALLQGVRLGEPLPWRVAGGIVARMLAFALPVALVLFLLFPRVPGPFWSLPSRGGEAMTGLSDEMSPGMISRLIQSDAVAFRANFEGPLPPPSERYWRGPVLERFDGWTWSDLERLPRLNQPFELAGPSYRYRLIIEPHGRAWLLALDFPGAWSDQEAFLTHEFQLVSRRPLDNVTAIEIESWPGAIVEAELGPFARHRSLRLPQGRNPRAVALGAAMRAAVDSDAALVDALLAHFRNEPFVYTLEPPALGSTHPVDEFLFRTRRGFCEHYASAFTVMARAAGLPARVVTGYLGGELNPLSGRLVVRQSDAHAWAEVWLAGKGWTRVDPTGAIAPERIELGLSEALPAGERVPGAALRQLYGLRALSQGWDALNSVWTDWVLGYGPERQLALLARLGLPNADWRALIAGLVVLVTLIMGGLALWLAWRSRGPDPDPARAAYDLLCARLAAAGLARAPAEGPADFARRVAAARPDLAAPMAALTRDYLAARYERARSAGALADLQRRVRAFRP
jgi:transglutaminase-like putative cysteine protease